VTGFKMKNQDDHLWLQAWRNQEIDFHQLSANKFLTKFWPKLNLASGSRIFIPLCGKSLDMIWFMEQGYKVIGVELSPVAVRAFFKENKLKHIKRKIGDFTVWENETISIFCGNYFSLSQENLGIIDIVYDRASLTALPEILRESYVEHLKLILPNETELFLLTTEDAEENETLKTSLGIAEEISALFSVNFDIYLTYVESVYEEDISPNKDLIRAEYKLYQLINKLCGKKQLHFI